MHTDWKPQHSETRTIAIGTPPADVHAFISNPDNFPRWAPGFASAVRRDGEQWIVTSAQGDAAIVMAADRDAGTVDVLRAHDRTRGAFLRVLPNGTGSEILFTLFFAPERPVEAVAAQMRVVEDELDTIRRLT
jgi:hypothetical protein